MQSGLKDMKELHFYFHLLSREHGFAQQWCTLSRKTGETQEGLAEGQESQGNMGKTS